MDENMVGLNLQISFDNVTFRGPVWLIFIVSRIISDYQNH